MDRFLIAPIDEGLRTDLKSWLIPDSAYAELNNAYIFRGRLKKRVGSLYTGSVSDGELGSRLRVLLPTTKVSVGTTNGSGDLSGTVSGASGKVGQKFSIGGEVFTCVVEGTPGTLTTTGSATTHTFNTTSGAFVFAGAAPTTEVYFYPDGGGHGAPAAGVVTGVLPGAIFKIGQQFSVSGKILTVNVLGTPATLLTTGTYSGTLNTTTGIYTLQDLTGSPNAYFYPAEPVMGLTQYEAGTVHNQTAYAFDTQFAYRYTGNSWLKENLPYWSGNNYNFVWSYNWDGVTANSTVLFTTNFNATTGTSPNGDPMYYYNGNTWTAWKPKFLSGTGYNIQTCRIIIPFKNRLLLLNTIESDSAGTTNYAFTNRCRYSQNGSPLNQYAFYEPNETNWLGGGYIDGPTEEDIVGAELIRDRCIIYFERSTWELAYTGNEAIPFIWQQVNTELGSEATFSTVPFDKFILNVGPNGIQMCNGINVDRIDDKIPDEVFDIRIKNQGMQRVAGVRDYYTEMVYWTYPTDDNPWAQYYPNKMFVFNYKNGTWALNDDCFTTFGYWEQQTDRTWADMDKAWAEVNQSWTSNVNAAQFRHVIAGNQHGYVVELARGESALVANLSVSGLVYTAGTESVRLRVNDHSLAEGDFIKLSGFNGSSISGIYKIYKIDDKDYIILNGIDSDPGTYTGGGVIARVPNLNILSKEWNPYKNNNRAFQLSRIDFAVKKTDAGQVTIEYYPSHSQEPLYQKAKSNGSALGTSVLETTPYALYPLEAEQRLLWHSVFFNAEGDTVQIRIYLSDDQMLDSTISESDFVLEGLILYTQPTRIK